MKSVELQDGPRPGSGVALTAPERRAAIPSLVAELEAGAALRGGTALRHFPAEPGDYRALPEHIDARLRDAYRRRGVEALYSHQREVLDRVEAGEHVAAVTPTASGKTLCYNAPVLDRILREPDARALYLFPTKALSQDQKKEILDLKDLLGEDVRADVYDGDTPGDARRSIRTRAHIVVTNPDMLHAGILPHHTKWAKLFENLRFVVEEQLRGRRIDASEPDETYAESVAAPIREAQAMVAGSRVAVIWRLLGYLRPYRKEVTAGLAAAGLITLVSLIPPYLAGYLLDDVIQPVQDGTLDVSRGALAAWVAVGAMALVYVVRQAGALVRLRMLSVLGEWVARDLRTELYEHLQRLSMSFYMRKKTGSIITRVSSDTDRLWEFLAFGVVDVSLSLVMLAGLGIVLLSLDWKLGLVMTAPVPVFCWASIYHPVRICCNH